MLKKYKADMEKEKEALTVSIQKKKQELSQIAFAKAEIKSVEQILTGKSTRRSLLWQKSSWLMKVRERNYQKKFLLYEKRINL